jgi:hypothetical protein
MFILDSVVIQQRSAFSFGSLPFWYQNTDFFPALNSAYRVLAMRYLDSLFWEIMRTSQFQQNH